MARRGRDYSQDDIPKAKITRESLREGLAIFRYLQPYRGRFILGMIFIALSSATTMAFPYLLKNLIENAQLVHDKKPVITAPTVIALQMLGVLAFQMLFSFMRIYLFSVVGENAVADMRKDIYTRLIRMPMEFFAKRRVGELSSRISSDVTQIQDTVTSVLAELLRGVLTLVIGLGLIIYLSPELTGIMLGVLPVIIGIALVFSRFVRKSARQSQDQLAESSTVVQETLQGITNVKAFANEWFEAARYGKSIAEVVRLAVKNGMVRGLFVSFMIFSLFGTIVLVIWQGASSMPISDLTAFVVYTAFVGGTLAGFADLYSQLQKTLGATQRVRELLQETTEEVSIEPQPAVHCLQGRVRFDNVSFTYPSRPEIRVLRDISLEVRQGEQIAIVGPSGAGKSTLVSMLLRFYEPDAGAIYFDDRPVASIPLTELRSQMALVPQDVLLFGGTIFDNIAYGKPGATQEEVEAAARQANAHQFIAALPEGYQTIVGERGQKLSGGQRQRLAIARAILKDPVILILDEATSSLDSESEALVQEALNNLLKNRTSFVIAHRLSTIRNADKIIVLEEGRVKESGTHQQLLEQEGGLYKSLTRLQTEALLQ